MTAQGEYLIVTPETLQSLTAKYIEMQKMVGTAEFSKDEMEAFKKLGQVLSWLREYGYNIADEADTILNPRRELNYTIGDSSKIKGSLIDVEAEIFTLLAKPPLSGLAKIKENEQSLNISTTYPKIKALLADHFAKKFADEKKQQNELRDYLLGTSTRIPTWVEALSNGNKNKIGLIRGQLNIFLPLTLSKQGYKDYTFSKSDEYHHAIPARMCQPIEGSAFGTPEEAMNYTLQHMLQKGINPELIGGFITQLKQDALRDLKKKTPREKIKAFQKFNEFCPDFDLFKITKEDWKKVAQSISSDPENLIAFSKKYVLSKIEVYPYKITNTSYDYVCGLHKVFGFTGTPWNSRAWHPRLIPILDQGTDALADGVLRQKAFGLDHPVRACQMPSKIHKNSVKAAWALISEIMRPFEGEENICALIDIGALLKGFKQDDIAQAFLTYLKDRFPHLKGIRLYIDNEIKIFSHDGRVYSESESPFSNAELFTFYDNSHTVGSDITQPARGTAVATLSEDLFHKDLTQGVYRMRELKNQQNVYYTAMQECYDKFLSFKEGKGEVDMDDILAYTNHLQRNQQKEDVFRAAQNAMSSLIRDIVLKKVIDNHTKGNIKASQAIFKAFDLDGVFVSNQDFEPWKQYSAIEEMIDPKDMLNRLRNDWLNKLKNIAVKKGDIYGNEIGDIKSEVIGALKEIEFPDNDRMPAKVPSPNRSQLNRAVHVQKQVQKQTQTQTQTQTQSEAQTESRDSYKHKELEYLIFSISFNDSTFKLKKIFYEADEIFSHFPELAKIVSSSMVPMYFSKNQIASTPFTTKQKPFNHVLIHRTGKKGSSSFQFFVLNDLDVENYKKDRSMLSKNESKDSEKDSMWLYASGARVSYASYGRKPIPEWEQDPDVRLAIIQLRLFNGEVHYQDEDLGDLEKYIRRMGSEQFQLFFQTISQSRESAPEYEGSILAEIVSNVAAAEQKEADEEKEKEKEKEKESQQANDSIFNLPWKLYNSFFSGV